MSFSMYTFKYLFALQIILMLYGYMSAKADFTFKANLIDKFTPITDEENSVPKTEVCDLGLPARRERCKAATLSKSLSEHESKVVFGTVSKATVYEFKYSSPVNGESEAKKWAFKCATKPLMFIVAGKANNTYDVMIAKSETSKA